MTFTPESQAQLTKAGEELYKLVDGLGNGFTYEDVSQAFALAMASQAIVDEIKADKGRALAAIVGAASAAYGRS